MMRLLYLRTTLFNTARTILILLLLHTLVDNNLVLLGEPNMLGRLTQNAANTR